jgi:putative PIN family toxin of toxin-antitoxin system
MTRPGRPGVVLDCMVFFQAASRPGGPAARLFIEFVETGHLTLSVSDAVLTEVRDVLGRPRIKAKNPTITDERVEELFQRIDKFAHKIDDVPVSYILPRDPDDEPYLNLAIATNADYLVTWDKDMLDLMQDAGFRDRFPQLTILNPVALLQVLTPPPDQPS